jgi:hypothetical protein
MSKKSLFVLSPFLRLFLHFLEILNKKEQILSNLNSNNYFLIHPIYDKKYEG